MKAPAEDIIFALLGAHQEWKELVGSRTFPEVAPEGTEDPWSVYQRIGNSDVTSHDGFDDLSEPTYQVTAWTQDAKTRKTLRGFLLDIFRMRRVTILGTEVVVAVVDDRDLTDDGPPRVYGASIDISVSF